MTEELKKALENAKTEEEKKAVIVRMKEELSKLSEDELEAVTGGKLDMVAQMLVTD